MHGQTNQAIHNHKFQRRLRGTMTDAERALWGRLRGRQLGGWKFRRQHPYLDYVLDFVCLEARLVIEVDGGQHAESTADAQRDARLLAAGLRVLRYWNNQVLHELDAVVDAIWVALGERPHPHPVLPPEGEGTYCEGR